MIEVERHYRFAPKCGLVCGNLVSGHDPAQAPHAQRFVMSRKQQNMAKTIERNRILRQTGAGLDLVQVSCRTCWPGLFNLAMLSIMYDALLGHQV